MIQDEIEEREAKKLVQRLSRASFEEQKSIEGFDFSFNPKIKQPLIGNLPRRLFIEKKGHVFIEIQKKIGNLPIGRKRPHPSVTQSILFELLFCLLFSMKHH